MRVGSFAGLEKVAGAAMLLAILQLSVWADELPGRLTLIEKKSTWRYLDDGSDQGSTWVAANFDDAAWKAGQGEFGYGDGDEQTVVEYGFAENRRVTTYFRRSLEITNQPLGDFETLQIELLADDGAVVYVNGTEVARDNIDPGQAFDTLADRTVSGDAEDLYVVYKVGADALQLGRNIIAVEVHQASRTSSDLSFDLRLMITTPAFEPVRPMSEPPISGGPFYEGKLSATSPGVDLFADRVPYGRMFVLESDQSPGAIRAVRSFPAQGLKAVADLDNDGDSDYLRVASHREWQLFVGANVGGEFEESVLLDLSPRERISPALADVNGDGLLDLMAGIEVVSETIADRTVYYLNEGDMRFGTAVELPAINVKLGDRTLLPAEITGDQWIDLIVIGQREVYRYRRTEDGSFVAPGKVRIDVGPNEVVAADLSGSGRADLVTRAGIHRNTGTGNFRPIVEFPSSFYEVMPFDFENDGDIDLLVSGGSGDEISWMINDGTGQFPESLPVASGPTNPTGYFDYDGDGLRDVLAVGGYFRQKKDPQLTIRDVQIEPVAGGTVGEVKVIWDASAGAQIFLNGKPVSGISTVIEVPRSQKLEVEARRAGAITRFSTHYDVPYFADEREFERYSDLNTFSSIAIGDLSGDGLPDVVYGVRHNDGAGGPPRGFSWSRNTGNGFEHQATITWTEGPDYAGRLLIKDIDNDGLQDVVVALDQARVIWFRNEGSGNLSTAKQMNLEYPNGYSFELFDFDGDGDLDAFTGSWGLVRMSRNNGAAGFGELEEVLSDPDKIRDFTPIDVDQDGDQDFVVVTESSDVLLYRMENGSRVGPGEMIDHFSSHSFLSSFDYDGDGDEDILQANVVYVNDGGKFSTSPVQVAEFPVVWQGPETKAVDIDGDGQTDIIDLIQLNWIRREGEEYITELPLPVPEQRGSEASLGDIDDDGDIDVAYLDGAGGWFWIENKAVPLSPKPEPNEASFAIKSVTATSERTIQVTWSARAGKRYELQSSSDLKEWSTADDESSVVAESDGIEAMELDFPEGRTLYLRVVQSENQ